ncbi:MAG: hypothetical protein JJ959_18370 [Nisaea sp.]|uniref:hypothetical protein n=1 Tax=Nisaea sp. TaxID=2024842 RepID=UPI001B2550AB|nr:hypothetical protein [Nisaea sp.]MBO6562518.1 hypothetical protein [Nisaea sp.]
MFKNIINRYLVVLIFILMSGYVSKADTVSDLRELLAPYGSFDFRESGRNDIAYAIFQDQKQITKQMYLAALPFACLAIREDPSFPKQFAILNRFGQQGYVFEDTGLCAEVTRTRVNELELLILGNSHLQ